MNYCFGKEKYKKRTVLKILICLRLEERDNTLLKLFQTVFKVILKENEPYVKQTKRVICLLQTISQSDSCLIALSAANVLVNFFPK